MDILVTRFDKQSTPIQFEIDPRHTLTGYTEQFQLAAFANTEPKEWDKSHMNESSFIDDVLDATMKYDIIKNRIIEIL